MAGTANPRDPSRQSAKPRCCSPPARMRAHLDGVSDSELAVSVRANLDSALGQWRPLSRAMDFRNAWWLNATGGPPCIVVALTAVGGVATPAPLLRAKAGARAGRHRHGLGLGPRSGGLDFDRPRRRGLRRGDPHLEHALRVLRLHLGGVDALRKGEPPLERAVRDLADEIVLARGVVIGLALALDGEDVVHQGHVHVLGIHARQGKLDDVGAVLRPPLRGGKPRRTLSRLIRGVAEEPRKEVVVVVEVELPGRGPAKHGVHGALLSKIFVLVLRLFRFGLGRSGNVSPLPPPPYTDRPRPLGRRRSCPQSSLPSVTAAGGTEDHRHPSRQDRQPRPVRHRRLLVTTLILRSCAPAVSSLSVLLDARRSAGGEPPWPDPQR